MQEKLQKLLPQCARPADTLTRSCSAIPISTNCSGYASAKAEMQILLESLQRTTISLSVSASLKVRHKLLYGLNLIHNYSCSFSSLFKIFRDLSPYSSLARYVMMPSSLVLHNCKAFTFNSVCDEDCRLAFCLFYFLQMLRGAVQSFISFPLQTILFYIISASLHCL